MLAARGVPARGIERAQSSGLCSWAILDAVAKDRDPDEMLACFWASAVGPEASSGRSGADIEAQEVLRTLLQIASGRCRAEGRQVALAALEARQSNPPQEHGTPDLLEAGAAPAKRQRAIAPGRMKAFPVQDKLEVEECERKKWLSLLQVLVKVAPRHAAHVQGALACARPEQALAGLWGKRRARTLKAIVKTFQDLEAWTGDKQATLQMSETDVLNFLMDIADRPCGKSVPEKILAHVDLVYRRLGLTTPIGMAARGQAALLKQQLARQAPREIRKALQPLLVVVVAMEAAVADEENSLAAEHRVIFGLELTKVYLSARWDDIEGLSRDGMKMREEFWGGERCFMSTKMTGPGCKTEVLPAWVARGHSFSGLDWVTPFVRLLDAGFGGARGAVARDPWAGGRLDYVKKLRLTRVALEELDIAPACHFLGIPTGCDGAVRLPRAYCALHTEHGARAFLSTLGMQLGIPKQRLNFLGRWVPGDSVEDYTRESRGAVLGIVRELCERVRQGWRPDESVTADRAIDRGGPEADISAFVSRSLPSGNGPPGLPVWPEAIPELPAEASEVAVPRAVHPPWESPRAADAPAPAEVLDPSKGEPGDAQVAISIRAGHHKEARILHAIAGGPSGPEVEETCCGKTLGREIKSWERTSFRWPRVGHLDFDRRCRTKACMRALGPFFGEIPDELSSEDVPSEDGTSSCGASSSASPGS